MKTRKRNEIMEEWKEILEKHPIFARVFLSQQAILLEASQLGFKLVDRSMCQLLDAGVPLVFEDYWTSRRHERIGEIHLSPLLECLLVLNRDPGRCFNLDPGDPQWFDDPLAEGKPLPKKPPIPPL